MQVGIFYNSISNPKKFSNKTQLMDNFSAGVIANGDQSIHFFDHAINYNVDVGFILGYTLEKNHRRRIIDTLTAANIPIVFVDSNILHYANDQHEWHRYSLGSVYPDTGIYFFDNMDQNKWDQYSKWHGVTVKPWRESGNHVLILCQRPQGWNMFKNDQSLWISNTVKQLQKYVPERPIVIRLHPRDGARHKQAEILKSQYSGLISVSTNENIMEDLKNCWCSIGFNSTPNAVSAIEGVPVYLEDPVHSWAADVGFDNFADVVAPPTPDRTEWLQQIANIHWSNSEVRSGKLWQAIRTYIYRARQQT
jgi:hypothetical protein